MAKIIATKRKWKNVEDYLYNMHDSSKSCVRQNHQCQIIIQQCWSLPRREHIAQLFSLFLNDLVELSSHGFGGLSDITEAIHLLCENDDIELYFKLYILPAIK